jgi:hypothetical protein
VTSEKPPTERSSAPIGAAGTPLRATLSASSSIFLDAATDIASCWRAATPWRIAIANSCALPAAIVTRIAVATSTSTSVKPRCVRD